MSTHKTIQDAFPRLHGTFSDGRLENVFYRREQLALLHAALLREKSSVLGGICSDSGNSAAESFAEFYLALSVIQRHRDSLDPKEELDLEYCIARGVDAETCRDGVGVVLVVPQWNGFVYSVIAPLSAAIAAGNCIVLVLEQTLHSLPTILSGILKSSLDQDILEITSKNTRYNIRERLVQVVQTADAQVSDSPNALVSPSDSLSIAIVDRTADLQTAAKSLLNARMRFGGRSPYAPDIVLVNEFAKRDFLSALAQFSIRYMAGAGVDDLGDGTKAKQRISNSPPTNVAKSVPQTGINIVSTSSNISIYDVAKRAAVYTWEKVRSPCLYVHAYRSLDDAISLANDTSHGSSVATYAFGDPGTCKYLLQFVQASAGYANHVPDELLIGPVVPKGQATHAALRYTTDMFSLPRPQFATKSATAREINSLLEDQQGALSLQKKRLLLSLQLEEPRKIEFITGYFERAALVGAVTIFIPLASGIGWAVYMGVRAVMNRT